MAETLILQSTGLQQKLWDQDQDRDPDHKRDRDRDKDPDQDQVQDRDQDTYHLHNRKTIKTVVYCRPTLPYRIYSGIKMRPYGIK